jgi:hypothetical protein
MNKAMRSKLWATLGASVLTLSVVTVALAIELKEEHRGITITWDANGAAVVEGFDADKVGGDECAGLDLAPGEIVFHFVQSPTQSDSGTLDVDFTGANDVAALPSSGGQGMQVDWDVAVTATADTVILVTANSSIADGELRVSHICVGEEVEESAPPSFEQSQEVETDEPSLPVITDAPSQPVITDAPSQPVITDAPSFEQSQLADTDEPSEPDTATIGGSKNVGSPADGAWLLVVALGVLLASIVVLTPARAKAPRR